MIVLKGNSEVPIRKMGQKWDNPVRDLGGFEGISMDLNL